MVAVKPCRVLVIDDAKDAADMLALTVRHLGHEAHKLTDERFAVEEAKRVQPGLILLDIGMPYINGYDLAPMLRKALAPKSVAIVAVTAWGSEQDRKHSKAAGFDAHVVKPADGQALARVIERLC